MESNVFFELGMDLEVCVVEDVISVVELRSIIQREENVLIVVFVFLDDCLDYFIQKEGVYCVGVYLIIDFYDVDCIDDFVLMEEIMCKCVDEVGVIFLYIYLYLFELIGVLGVVVLVESYIFVYIWLEVGYVVFDVFMCGDVQLEKCVEVLCKVFNLGKMVVFELLCGWEVVNQFFKLYMLEVVE